MPIFYFFFSVFFFISLVFLCVASLQAFLLTYFRERRWKFCNCLATLALASFAIVLVPTALIVRLRRSFLLLLFFGTFLTSIKYIFHDYKWDLFAISGNISGSALPSRVCGHKNAKKLLPNAIPQSPLPLYSSGNALLHFCRINQLFSLLFSLFSRTRTCQPKWRRRTMPNVLLIGASFSQFQLQAGRKEGPVQAPLINYHVRASPDRLATSGPGATDARKENNKKGN